MAYSNRESETESEGELNLSRGPRREDLTEAPCLVGIPPRQAEGRRVEEIEELCAEFHPRLAPDGDPFRQREIKVYIFRPCNHIPPAVAKGVTIRHSECIRIEKAIGRSLLQAWVRNKMRTVRPEQAADVPRVAVISAEAGSERESGLHQNDGAQL